MMTTPITEDFVRGTPYSEPTDPGLRLHRLPAHVRVRDADAQLALMESHPSGVRIEFVDELPGGKRRVAIWLRHNVQIDLIALHTDAEVRPLSRSERASEAVWLHYGSSIRQGSNAAPTPPGSGRSSVRVRRG